MLASRLPFVARAARAGAMRARGVSTVSGSDEVLVEQRHGTCVVTLSRPKALNALNYPMVQTLRKVVEEVDADPGTELFVMQGAGDKAFCAGGDVVALYHAKKSGGDLTRAFFWDEYKLDHRIATMPKPSVALMKGITMGGGMGLIFNNRFKIATNTSRCAMPETGIGFFCDVGGSFFLPRLTGGVAVGNYYALTGLPIRGYDAYKTGVATHYVPEERWEKLTRGLSEEKAHENLEGLLADCHREQDEHSVPLDLINKHFGKSSVPEIVDSLAQDESEEAKKTLAKLRAVSPLSLFVVFEQLQRGKDLSLAECFQMEFRLSQAFMRGHDFSEGVRALLVDKDNAPQWQPATIAAVSPEEVQSYFEPLENDLTAEELAGL